MDSVYHFMHILHIPYLLDHLIHVLCIVLPDGLRHRDDLHLQDVVAEGDLDDIAYLEFFKYLSNLMLLLFLTYCVISIIYIMCTMLKTLPDMFFCNASCPTD